MARRSGRPGVVAWRMPRHSRSSSSAGEPGGASGRRGVRSVMRASHGRGRNRLGSGPVGKIGRPLPCMVSFRPSCKPASPGGSVTADRWTGAARAEAVPPRSRSLRFPSSCSPPCSCSGRPVRPASVAAYSYLAKDLQDPKAALDAITFTEQTTVYDRTGDVLLASLGDDRREVVTFDQIPPVLVDATTSIEDKTFWDNAGFDPAGFISAAIDTISGNDRGGSTITQQLVRARLLPAERLHGRRLRAQGQGDHPVDPPDPGLSGRGRQEGDHGEVPQPELLRQPQLRRRGGGTQLLRRRTSRT